MDSLQNTSTKEFIIVVAGDPIDDEYVFGKLDTTRSPIRFYPNGKDKLCWGGAANVARNIESMVPKSIECREVCDFEPYVITRLVDAETNEIIMETAPRSSRASDQYFWPTDMNWAHAVHTDGSTSRMGLVISDYNKGTVNRPLTAWETSDLKRSPGFGFIIVDSRYGTYNRDLLKYGRMKILHVTGDEWDAHIKDIDKFNYVIVTNGEHPVNVYKPCLGEARNNYRDGLIKVLRVPYTEVVDTTGAGDTFVASLAADLAMNANVAWDDELIKRCVEHAIERCQSVIQKFGTTTP